LLHSLFVNIEQMLLDLGLAPALVVFVVAALPVVELRGAIPLGINVLDLPFLTVFALAVVGNMLPVPFILKLIDWLAVFLSRFPFFKRLFDWLFTRTRARSDIVQRYGGWGLALFVAIPLPMTGAWTGALAAVLLGIPFREAVLFIFIGVFAAGTIVTTLALMGWSGAIIAGVALAALIVAGGLKRRRVS
jgi:uncharacterized membrane protein